MPSSPPPLPSPAEPATVPPTEPRRRSPAVVVLLVVLMLIGGILYWTVASDHHAPGSSRGIVSANVAQISPRVSGRVIAVETEDNAILEAGAVLFRIDPRPFEIAVETAPGRLAELGAGQPRPFAPGQPDRAGAGAGGRRRRARHSYTHCVAF